MESKMSFSRLGIFVLILAAVFTATNCSIYNRVASRKNLVDGSEAYKGRKFAEAEDLFRRATERDPEGKTLEGKMAQIFLARTLHSEYVGNRKEVAKAEEAIAAYQKALTFDPNDQTSYKAVAGLYENLGKTDDWQRWVTERSVNESIKPQYRADALVSLGAKQNTCANEISDTDATKKPGKRDGKDVFLFTKPEDQAEFDKLKACVEQGTKLIDQAAALETDEVRNAKNVDLNSLTDAQLADLHELVKSFESVRSYKASMLIQASRVAEMDGDETGAAKLRDDADAAREAFIELSGVSEKIQAEKDSRVAEAKANANANAASANQ
jgi:tetratricopeptide (TPR) repeat protein